MIQDFADAFDDSSRGSLSAEAGHSVALVCPVHPRIRQAVVGAHAYLRKDRFRD